MSWDLVIGDVRVLVQDFYLEDIYADPCSGFGTPEWNRRRIQRFLNQLTQFWGPRKTLSVDLEATGHWDRQTVPWKDHAKPWVSGWSKQPLELLLPKFCAAWLESNELAEQGDGDSSSELVVVWSQDSIEMPPQLIPQHVIAAVDWHKHAWNFDW
jgi:hypothetical protein